MVHNIYWNISEASKYCIGVINIIYCIRTIELVLLTVFPLDIQKIVADTNKRAWLCPWEACMVVMYLFH
jgi:hypothetical protein